MEKALKPLLIGEDPLLIEHLWQKMFARTRQYGRRGLVMQAISGIDIALWDIAGKRRRGRGLPRPWLQGHEDEDRPQPIDRNAFAPADRPGRVLRG
ncbi:MAG: hypothetical protein E6G81_03090 [Alphaproteobacteria bacterium]|nr:MAG: hypothetical protein E6G81_03090 [Alphaproteobacteria bacterium]